MLRVLVGIFILSLANVLLAQEPTIHSSNVTLSDTFCSSVTLSWTAGNGSSRVVVVSEGSPISTLPTDNVFYFGNKDYGSGSMLSSSEYVVYNGSGTFMVIDDLKKNTTYYISIFEYSRGAGGNSFNYFTSAGYPEVSFTTKNITVDFTIDDPYQCENGNFFNFTSTASHSENIPFDYFWNFGDGNTSTSQNTSHSHDSFGLYKVSLIVSNFKCADTMIKFDTVAPNPEPTISLDQDSVDAGYGQAQCFINADGIKNSFFFRATTPFKPLNVGSDLTGTFWKFGDGNEENRNRANPNHSYDNPGIYTVWCIQSTSVNDERDFCLDSTSYLVTVFPSPIDSSLLDYDTAQCFDNNLFRFEHNVDPSVTNIWSSGDGTSQVGSQVSHSYLSDGVFHFELNAEDTNGCVGIYEDSVEVIPQPNNEINGLESRYCLNDDPVQLTTTMTGGTWLADNFDPSSEIFSPSQLGVNVLRYAVDEDGCLDTAEVSTEVFPVPEFELGNDTSVCVGESITISIERGDALISWSTGDTDSFTQVSNGGLLWAEKSEGGCDHRDSIMVTSITVPVLDLGPDSLLCGDGVREIDIQAAEATYTWNDGYTGGGQRSITSTGMYSVTVTNKCGTASDEVNLEFLPYVCDIFVPNVFTPNGDGLNDVFKPSGNVEIRSMQVFNRWGEMLYSNFGDREYSWDGLYQNDPVQNGHYFFTIRYFLPEDGKELPLTISGEVYLLR